MPGQHGELAPAPHRVAPPHLFDALDLLACRAGLARAMRTPAFGFGLFIPPVERGAGMPDRLGGLVGGKALAHDAFGTKQFNSTT